MRVSEVDPLLKKRAPIELIVNPTIRSATAAGSTSPLPSTNAFTEFKVEFVAKLLRLAGSQRMVTGAGPLARRSEALVLRVV